MKIADTFLLKAVVREPHIWVVAYYQDLTAVTFNFTTRQASSVDLTCTIGPAEYSELRHESVMPFQHGKLWEGEGEESIRLLEDHGISRFMNSVSSSVLRKIQQGAVDSPFTSNKIKTLVRAIL